MFTRIRALVPIAALLLASNAMAGQKTSNPVAVDATARVANGSLGSARNSADNLQYIGCAAGALSFGGTNMYCFAQTADNVYAECQSTSPQLVQAAQAMSGDSYVHFAWDASGTCTYLLVINSSRLTPKQP